MKRGRVIAWNIPPAWDVNVRDMILKEPIVARNGKVKIPNKPGLGIELDEDIIRRYTVT